MYDPSYGGHNHIMLLALGSWQLISVSCRIVYVWYQLHRIATATFSLHRYGLLTPRAGLTIRRAHTNVWRGPFPHIREARIFSLRCTFLPRKSWRPF